MEALATVCVVVLHEWCAGGLFSIFSFKRAEVRGMTSDFKSRYESRVTPAIKVTNVTKAHND